MVISVLFKWGEWHDPVLRKEGVDKNKFWKCSFNPHYFEKGQKVGGKKLHEKCVEMTSVIYTIEKIGGEKKYFRLDFFFGRERQLVGKKSIHLLSVWGSFK